MPVQAYKAAILAWMLSLSLAALAGAPGRESRSATPIAGARSATPATGPSASIVLRAWGVPEDVKADIDTLAKQAVVAEFQTRFPHIKPVASTGLSVPGRTLDILPLMQIAGDIPAHVMYVNFRQSETYIANKFLYPLDRYIENTVGLAGGVKGGHLLDLDEYLSRLKAAPRYKEELDQRAPYQCWKVMRRKCPYGADCPYLREWGEAPADKHFHTWCFPEGALVMGLFYRRDLFQEAGLPDRVPETLDELLEWARKLSDPKEKQYGLMLRTSEITWNTLSFLYSYGGLLVDEDENGEWRCVYDSPQAVDAYHYLARLLLQPFENERGRQSQMVYESEGLIPGDVRYAMFFMYLNEQFFGQYDPAQWGFGPVPKGPTGLRGSEFNSRMAGVYAGCDEAARDAAWEYIRFYDGPEARLIRAKVFVDNGLGHYILPDLLRAAGYPKIAERVPKGWEESFRVALENGIPEPYGRNCQQIYRYSSQSINQILTDPVVREAVADGDDTTAKKRIAEILADGVKRNNEKMLSIIPPGRQTFRNWVAGLAATFILFVFALVFRRVFRVFAESEAQERAQTRRGLQLTRYKWAYLLLIPAAGSIALWEYYPLARGSLMAFQNYNVRGFSEWIGFSNLANVLFDGEFWFAMWVSLKWAVLFMLFGFCAPIVLALLLTETPRGKLLFRLIYYLPAVLSGVLVVYLWKGFYGSEGMVNQLLNSLISLLNLIPGVELRKLETQWLNSPDFALFFCLLPIVWAGMGPGCLIYLAALKTIPEEMYEAADIDGAGPLQKVFHVTIPGIRGLIAINFIGVMVAQIKGGGQYVLAMTGGGPYTPYGQTELVGLHIFWEAFGFLRFGTATSMAWVLGSFLIGFTVLQMQRLSRMEFRTAGK